MSDHRSDRRSCRKHCTANCRPRHWRLIDVAIAVMHCVPAKQPVCRSSVPVEDSSEDAMIGAAVVAAVVVAAVEVVVAEAVASD